MATAMATIAHTVDSSPVLMPERIVVAGPVRAESAISWTGSRSVDVKYSVSRLTTWARTRPATTAPNIFQPSLPWSLPMYQSATTSVPSTVKTLAVKKPRLIGAIAVAIGTAVALGNGNIQFSFYLVALTGMGMLATTGVVVSEDTFGPVADNAAGIAEMSGEFEGEPERIMVSLDAVGNTTKAVTKGFAIGSAVIAAVALFASFVETAGGELDLRETGSALFAKIPINVADPKTFIGLLIGGSIAFLFSALAIRAVGRTAGTVVQEVRNQFADGQIMKGTKKPDSGKIVDICTAASLRELATPALLAVLTPVIIGFGINYLALGAFLAAVILTGQLMAVFLSVAGGAWDNAKKYIEDGHYGGKGSEAHKAAVIGDTVGDPFKDTAGPALNPLIKVMNLVSLLILPAVISLRDNNGARWAIAGAALVVLLVAIGFSKRKVGGLTEEPRSAASTEPEHEPAGTATPS